jgi:hypothetical protein
MISAALRTVALPAPMTFLFRAVPVTKELMVIDMVRSFAI